MFLLKNKDVKSPKQRKPRRSRRSVYKLYRLQLSVFHMPCNRLFKQTSTMFVLTVVFFEVWKTSDWCKVTINSLKLSLRQNLLLNDFCSKNIKPNSLVFQKSIKCWKALFSTTDIELNNNCYNWKRETCAACAGNSFQF